MTAKSKLSPHLLVVDHSVPADQHGRRFCTCGAREDHERHTLPTVPEQAQVAARYEHDDPEEN